MKKIAHFTFVFFAGILVTLSCSKIGDVDTDNGDAAASIGKQIIIHATLPDAPTRVEYALDETGEKPKLTLKWESTDVLVVSKGSASVEMENPTIDETGKTATFSGTLPEGGEPYTVYVKHAGTNMGAVQNQVEDGDLTHLEYAAMAEGVYEADFEDLALTQTTGVLGLIAKLPTDVSANVKAVIFQTENALFNDSNTLTVNLGTSGAGPDNILYVYANVAAASIPTGTEMFIRFKVGAGENDYYTRYQVFTSDVSLNTGALNGLKLNCNHIDRYAGKDDKGTAAAPYLIADKYQMDAMHVLAGKGTKTYFKMMDDIDLEGIAWTPLNVPSPYDIGIDFNGNGKTVNHLSSTGKYASFAGVLNGSVYNVFFDNATITTSQDKAGVVAGYLGSSGSGISAECRGITIKNSKVTSTSNNVGGLAGIASKLSNDIVECHVIDFEGSGVLFVGGLLGCLDGEWIVSDCSSSGTISSSNAESNKDICLGGLVGDMKGNATVTKCSSSVRINQTKNGRDIGGLVGRLQTGTVEKSFSTGNVKGMQRNVGGFIGLITNTQGTSSVSDCYSTGNVSANAYSGGFLGLHEKGAASISNCYATGDVEGSGFGLGGIIGFVGAAAMTMNKTVAWNGNVVPVNHGSGNWSSGAVVGVTFPICTLTDNYRSPSMLLTAFWVPDADYDHPDVSATTPLVVKDINTGELRSTTASGTSSGNDNYPQFAYHGKHVAAGTTLSQLASDILGWSSDVWDFSGELPTLK